MSAHRRSLLAGMTVAFLMVAAYQGFFRIAQRFAYEAAGPINSDSAIYLAVGRGMLNGITPYSGLYDIKPPGIYLLSAVSLALTGDNMVVSWAQVASFIVIFLSVLIPSIALRRRTEASWVVPFCGFSFGAILAYYSAVRSGAFQVESFGAAFVCMYAAMLVLAGEKPMSRVQTVCAGALVAASVFMKEPFALVALASCLLLVPTRKAFVRNAVFPALLAIAFFFSWVWMTGALEPYFSVYLREMFFNHVGIRGRLSDRMFDVVRLVRNFNDVSKIFGWVLVALFGGSLTAAVRSVHAGVRVLAAVAALCLTMTAVAAGGDFYGHHFVFAVPFYTSIFFVFLTAPRLNVRGIPAVLLALVLVAALRAIPARDYTSALKSELAKRDAAISVASGIDTMLRRCGQQRYLFLGANGIYPYGYTVHSPLGPLFHQYNRFFSPDRPQNAPLFLGNLTQAQIIVAARKIRLGSLTETVKSEIAARFTTEPWPCARNVDLGKGYTVFFRHGAVHAAGLAEPSNQH